MQYTLSATTNSLEGMLLGRFFVGTGMGLGPPVAALYVSEVQTRRLAFAFGRYLDTACHLQIRSLTMHDLFYAGFTSSCEGHLREFHPDCNMSWTYDSSPHRDSC